MIDAAERERHRQALAKQWATSWLDTQGKAPGINLGEMDQSLAEMLLRWGAACANEALEKAAVLCERDLTNEEDAEWNAFEGGHEIWLAKRIRALQAEGIEKPAHGINYRIFTP